MDELTNVEIMAIIGEQQTLLAQAGKTIKRLRRELEDAQDQVGKSGKPDKG